MTCDKMQTKSPNKEKNEPKYYQQNVIIAVGIKNSDTSWKEPMYCLRRTDNFFDIQVLEFVRLLKATLSD